MLEMMLKYSKVPPPPWTCHLFLVESFLKGTFPHTGEIFIEKIHIQQNNFFWGGGGNKCNMFQENKKLFFEPHRIIKVK